MSAQLLELIGYAPLLERLGGNCEGDSFNLYATLAAIAAL
jgi:hypothetical protein